MRVRLLACALAVLSVQAAAADDTAVRRNRDGSINYAPRPAAYTVVAVDAYNRIVRLRARNGATADVLVPDGVYDLDRLKAGDRVQVDFRAPDQPDSERLAAATIWPLR